MTLQERLAKALDQISTGTRVIHMRAYDAERAERNGNGQDAGLLRAVERLEAAAADVRKAVTK